MTTPTLLIEVALASGAYLTPDGFIIGDPERGIIGNSTYTIAPSDVWVDVSTGRLRSMGGSVARLFRGREREFDQPTVGTADFRLDNRDGVFNPLNPASPYAGQLRPMRRMRASAVWDDGTKVAVWGGYIEDWPVEYPSVEDAITTVSCIGPFGPLAAAELAERVAQDAGDLAGARITKVLDMPEVAYPATRRIDSGVSTLGATTYGENALQYLQTVAMSDNGTLAEGRDGTLEFRDRHTVLTTEPTVSFAGSRSEGMIPYRRAAIDTSAVTVRNRVLVSGVSETVQVVTDTDSIDEFQPRTLDRTGMLVQSDSEAENIGRYLLGRYAQPTSRISYVTVDLAALTPVEQQKVLALDTGSRVEVTFTPPGVVGIWPETWDDIWGGDTSPITRPCVIEGVEHDKPKVGWTVTFFLSPADTRPYLRIGDETYGVIGSNRIAY